MRERAPKEVSDPELAVTRRVALRGLLASMGVALVPAKLGDGEQKTPEGALEKPSSNERFENLTEGYKAWWNLPANRLLFVDGETGAPVGETVLYQDYEVDKSDKTSPCDPDRPDDCYRLTPAEPAAWIAHVKRLHAAQHNLPIDQLEQRNVNATFKAALANKNESELVAGIQAGAITTPLQIVAYFGSKPVRGAEDYSRISYIHEKVEFNSAMPQVVQRELRSLIPALCAKESKYNDDLESSVGAAGITQFMPGTVAGLKGYEQYVGERIKTKKNDEGILEEVTDEAGNPVTEKFVQRIPLTIQTEMLGRHFDNIYREFLSDGVSELLEAHIVPCFADRESYERDFLVSCLINAYNPGAGRLRRAVKEFVAADEVGKVGGKDLFMRLSQFAAESNEGSLGSFGPESFAYTYHVYALRDLFQEEGWIPKAQDQT